MPNLLQRIAAGERYFFNDDENMKIMDDNRPFVAISDIEPTIIDSLFRKPYPNEMPEELQFQKLLISGRYYKLMVTKKSSCQSCDACCQTADLK